MKKQLQKQYIVGKKRPPLPGVHLLIFLHIHTLSSREISTAFRRNSRNYKKYEITISGIHLVNFTPLLVTSVCSAHHPPVKGVICPFTLPSAVLIPPQQEWIYCSDAVDCFFFSSRVFLKAGHQVVVSNIYHSITFTLLYLLAHFPIAQRKKNTLFLSNSFPHFSKAWQQNLHICKTFLYYK